jgi:lipopolysaccharide/colanic/teichoic acid biosynthesis glycosyltransferase
MKWYHYKLKNFFDRLTALLSLLWFWPVLLIIAILIKVNDKTKPILFKQLRPGQYGKPFVIYKFRTMSNGEVTKIGEVLRKYKLDELPQLFNVLTGDMWFCGPRPGLLDDYSYEDEKFKTVLNMKPGITCLSTVKYRNEEYILRKNPELEPDIKSDKLNINYWYYYNYNIFMDIAALFDTIFKKLHFTDYFLKKYKNN